MECRECGSKYIVNKTYCLCDSCNQIRLHGKSRFDRFLEQQSKKPVQYTKKKSNRLKPPRRVVDLGKSSSSFTRTISKIKEDEVFYEKVFNQRPHKCEECGYQLNEVFRDEEGKVINRWQYSHVVPKSIAPELRHEVNAMNRLCFDHHSQWENGDKESMKIFKKNSENYPQYLIKTY